ncbi:hypothetical protein BD410DRAFT_725213 [Rickenella mellea]|uniref:Uncharacterized protein n=1 Tax=Rickenella mellea TaxID=50990 RepID=A0A4Y7PZK3_9AGAM|nr:hypothetical protein BD410DRAFT_725213 [Rickenella mellea]
MTVATDNTQLAEEQVADAFHSYLKSSLAQAKAERLLDTELLSSAEADLMITGPALCMYFAALRCTTSPPSVPLPRTSKTAPPMDLSPTNCPPPFAGFLAVWARHVQDIQNLQPEHQHDLARVICGLEPLASPPAPQIPRIAAELRAVAIEISQRRTFQDRYAADLQAALDASSGGGGAGERSRVKASFVPPPMYDASPSPTSSNPGSPRIQPQATNDDGHGHLAVPSSPPPGGPGSSHTHVYHHSRNSSNSSNSSQPLTPTSTHSSYTPDNKGGYTRTHSRTPSPTSPTFLPPDGPAITLIRETLYAALADVLVRTPSIRTALKRDPPRAYFSAVALAILDVSRSRTHISPAAIPGSGQRGDVNDVSVLGVLGARLTLNQCPPPLQPFMRELALIGAAARAMEDEDAQRAVEALQSGARSRNLPDPRMERVRRMLAGGVGAENDRTSDGEGDATGRRSVEGRAVAFANRVNALALAMTKLRAFRERQDEVFKILAMVTS